MVIDDLVEAASGWNNTEAVDLKIAALVTALYDECAAGSACWSRRTRLQSASGCGYLMRINPAWRGKKLRDARWEDVEFCPRLAALSAEARTVIGRAFLAAVHVQRFVPRVQYGCAAYP